MEYGKDFQEDDILIALRNLSMYCNSEVKIDDATAFLDFYGKTVEILEFYAQATDHSYVLEKVKRMPQLNHDDVHAKKKTKLEEVGTMCDHMLFTIENPGFFIGNI